MRTAADILFGSPLAMVVLWGPDLVQIYNDGYAVICGPRHPAALGQPTRDCWPEVWEFNRPIYERVLRGEARSFTEQPLTIERHGAAEEAWFDLTYSPLCDEGGGVAGVLVTVVETTARVLADRRLAAERLRQRQQFEQAPGFICVSAGPEHIYEFGNGAYARLIGREDFVGKSVRDALPDIAGQGFYDLLDGVYRTGRRHVSHHTPVSMRRTPGEGLEERFVDFIYAPVLDEAGRVTGIFTQGHDVTDAHVAETALRESEARLRALNADLQLRVMDVARERARTWEVSPELLGVLTPNGVFESSNPAWRTLLGWSPEEVGSTAIFELLHPDDVEATRSSLDFTSVDPSAVTIENRYRGKDGAHRWISWVCAPKDGKIYCSGRDITMEKEQAAELASAQEHLRQSHKLEAIGQLTGGVAHDFNNLLTIIQSSVDFLRRSDLPETRRSRYVNAIADTVTRATTLTSQLLAFARRQPLKPSIFEVSAQIRSIVKLIRPLTGNRIEVGYAFEKEDLFAKVDLSQFETALVNLAVNARDAMNGVGKLTFGVREVAGLPEIRCHVASLGGFIAISITVCGAGIPPEMLDSIFEPFFTTKGVGKGTGLGLSQVFGFAKQSGGEVDVDSEPGRGSTFTIYLPLTARPAIGSSVLDGGVFRETVGAGLSILLVEDNQAVGDFATEMLTDLGHTPLWVESASAALAALSKDDLAFDVVFSDVIMPGMSGLEMAKLIRVRHPGLPVILTSGYSDVIAREGHDGFELLQKPYSVDALSRVLRKATLRSIPTVPAELDPSRPSRRAR